MARVLFDAAAGVNLPPQQRRVGYVFQGYALFPHLTVAGNVGFGLRDRSRHDRERRVAEVLERLDLGGLAHRHPSELSGGQRQRVALGRALAIDPALLLLDEPLSALDSPLRRALRDELRAILSGWGTAAVVVTHDFTEAYRLADRIIVYENGRVIQAAARAELLWQPASEAVARVMGLRNVLHGHRREVDARSHPDPLARPDARGGQLADALVPAAARQPDRVLHPPRIRAPGPQGSRAGRTPPTT